MSIMPKAGGQLSSNKRRHEEPSDRASRKARKLSEDTSPSSDEKGQETSSSRPSNKHTKKDRKQNRSSRIHSLRKLLARGKLPSTIKQEKERELAALLHEQDKTKTKKDAKKTLERYHYVRFIERQKAEKRLKRLRKQKDAGNDNGELDNKIHEMEVNRNYAIYAPLDQKYASIFASQTGHEKDDEGDEAEEGKAGNVEARTKPPMWYVVKAAMAHGEVELKALRDGKSNPSHTISKDIDRELVSVWNQKKVKATSSTTHSRPMTRNMEDDTVIHRNSIKNDSSEGEMSDGGFFDR